MMRTATLVLLAGAVIVGLFLYWTTCPGSTETATSQQVTVTSIVDGDTLRATDETGHELGRLRILGIDTPEMPRDGTPGECHAQRATAAAEQLLDGAVAQISHDQAENERDRYGRLLVYVDVEGTDFAETMLRQGHARLYGQSRGLSRYEVYQDAEREAQRHSRGLWADCSRASG